MAIGPANNYGKSVLSFFLLFLPHYLTANMSSKQRQIRLADDLEDDFVPDEEFAGWASDVSDSDAGHDSDNVVSGVKRRIEDDDNDTMTKPDAMQVDKPATKDGQKKVSIPMLTQQG
jgi:hypothetical protein